MDDYQFTLTPKGNTLELALLAQNDAKVQRFGHMLILKLAHGLISWLDRKEVPVNEVSFAFERPSFAQDYSAIFPANVHFSCKSTAISFLQDDLGPVQPRSTTELDQFLENAPRDWIFTRSREHTQALRVRSCISQLGWDRAHLTEVARTLHMTSRTLIRRLAADDTSFQAIKDALRRDIAIRHLAIGVKSIEEVAHEVGFSSNANFYRAFQSWTGSTPSTYRNVRR